ncbi:DNA polymerase IV [candidate division KSB1 bacterium]|nr:DNA polymerase IV [candidate division KSB1 bacterium]
MSSKIILHIDMDAFFAAVEQRDHPEYKGLPVIVGADPKDGKGRGVVSTCSYEARKYGIHSAMPISQAYRLCPLGIYLRGRMSVYQSVSRQLMQILSDFTSLVEPLSIDEAFLDITGSIRLLGTPEKIARKIQQRIADELHLTASIGIAPNKFVAKIASDLNKPNGLVIVEEHQIRDFLAPLPISKLWGVGKKTQPIFLKYGIRTIGELANSSKERIVTIFGNSGLHFWNLANGIDDRDVVTHTPAKSVSQEITFDKDIDDLTELHKTLLYLVTELTRLIRKDHYKAKTITLKVRLADFSTFTRSHTLSDFTDSFNLIHSVISDLFHRFNCHNKKIRLLGVAVSNLNTQQGGQISIFDQENQEKDKADKVLDLIQNKFGVDAIQKGTLIDLKHRDRLTDQKIKQDKPGPGKR